MTGRPDYVQLRSDITTEDAVEEQVQVNQRNLIDKILARYATEWSVLRELIQNAADANATTITIKFETHSPIEKPFQSISDRSASLRHAVLHHTIARLIVSNNGIPFTLLDWNRLRNIAEGNPDETKIGAFGVGFYSVFSDCDEPLVISGNETMAFYWKGNALFTKKGKIPSRQINSDTAFILDYRGLDSPVPPLFSLCQFLSTSLTFVALERIDLWLDDWNLMTLSKKLAPAMPVPLPKDIDPKTQDRLMRVASLTNRTGQIDAEFLNVIGWTPCQTVVKKQEPRQTHSGFRDFLSRVANSALKVKTASSEAAREEEALQQAISDDLLGSSRAAIFIRLTIAGIQTDCRKRLAQELERATKKAPPSQTSISILTSPYEEQSASISAVSGSASKKATSLFTSVLPKEGRLFIGFRTAQTTGFEAHVSAPSLIPTVERENIDLSAKHVSTWNIELLRAVGIVLRIGYSLEYSSLYHMLSLSKRSEEIEVTGGSVSSSVSAAVHTIKCYTKRESTPSPLVADLVEEAFWSANLQHIEVLSTIGILPSSQVRITAEPLPFLTTIPILHSTVREENSAFFQILYDKGMITDVTLKDIKDDLGSKALGEMQAELFMKWAAAKTVSMEIDSEGLRNLFSAVVVTLDSPRPGTLQGTVLPLADIISFVNNSGVPPDCPVPPSTAPFSLTKSFSRHQLLAFGWRELKLTEWIYFLVSSSSRLPESFRLESSPDFATKVLKALSKSWDASSKENLEIIDLLSSRTVIPTKQGMKKPSAAYFPTVRLFDDLPVIKGLQGIKEKLLLALGVRKTIELSVVFSRLMTGQKEGNNVSESTWSHIDLIKYLSSIRGDIPSSDIERLRQIRIWPSEKSKSEDSSKSLYKMSELYQPIDEVRSLHLPVLQWHGNLRTESNEGDFLYALGLQKFPSAFQLVDMMTEAGLKKDAALWDLVMRYFLENYYKHSYSTFDISKVSHKRFVPLTSRPFPDLSKPADCFSNEHASILGYSILRRDLHNHAHKLGVREDPPIEMITDRVIKTPATKHADARLIFEYLSGRLQEIGPSIADLLGNANIVPVKDLGGPDVSSYNKVSIRHAVPKMCFLGDPTTYGKILDFVDYGSQGNAFLVKVGAGREPGVLDLAQILAVRPRKLLETLGEHKYLDLLRKLAGNVTTLRANTTLWENLKNTAALLGYRDVLNPARTYHVDENAELEENEKLLEEMSDDNDLLIREWSLSHPYSLAVNDSVEDYTIFRKSLLTAPQEEGLEALYLSLGTPYLSSLVKSIRRVGPAQRDQSSARKVHRLIMERCRIFLHDHESAEIKHDMKWLDRYLKVEAVEYISLQKKLIAHAATHSEKVTACLDKNSISRTYVLSVTHNYDLYEVSQALIQELLKRHKHQDIMALEVILGSDLRKLKIRGYNIDRILRQRELESRIAADKSQRLQEEQVREHKAVQEREAESIKTNETSRSNMPGSFKIEPSNGNIAGENLIEKPNSEIKPNRSAGKFMSNLSKRFGLNEAWDRSSTKLIENPKESMTKPEALNQNLMSAIRSSRAYNSNSMFSAPSTTMIPEAEQGAYCDSSEGHDLVFCNVVPNDVKVFVTRQESAQVQFIQTQTVALSQFASLILACAEVFELERASLNIFYSTHTKSIAFNYKGSLFCNFHFFSILHHAGFEEAENRREAAIYWFVVLCHELAHNLVKTHDSKHSYYTASFVQRYFSKMASTVAQI